MINTKEARTNIFILLKNPITNDWMLYDELEDEYIYIPQPISDSIERLPNDESRWNYIFTIIQTKPKWLYNPKNRLADDLG